MKFSHFLIGLLLVFLLVGGTSAALVNYTESKGGAPNNEFESGTPPATYTAVLNISGSYEVSP